MSERALTTHEVEVLEMLDGKRPGEWGAWVSACLEFLAGMGYCTPGPKYGITSAGKAALLAHPTKEESPCPSAGN